MSKEKILVVEDEADILELLTFNLEKEGYQVTGASAGEAGLQAAGEIQPDLILLDLMLPGVDGLEVCRRLKGNHRTVHIPIVMLTAKSEETDIVTGLELGADDYVTKPFSPRVLIARIRSVLRRRTRQAPDGDEAVQIHDVLIHPGRHEVTVGKEQVNLTSTEFRILHFLAGRPGWVFTRDQIIDSVHGDDYPVTDRSIDVQIMWLRKKLGDAGQYIETVRGVGYRFRERG